MTKYRKKPIEVEAMLFTEDNKDIVFNWVKEFQFNIYPSFDTNGKPMLIVPTLDGDMVCSIGDYMIKEPFPTDWRKFYPCKPDIFEKTYELSSSSTGIKCPFCEMDDFDIEGLHYHISFRCEYMHFK